MPLMVAVPWPVKVDELVRYHNSNELVAPIEPVAFVLLICIALYVRVLSLNEPATDTSSVPVVVTLLVVTERPEPEATF